MKSLTPEPNSAAPLPQLLAATAQSLPAEVNALARARAFAEPLLVGESLDTGENILAHADAVAAILKSIGGSEAMQAASYLVYACDHLNKPQEVIAKAFGDNFAALAMETTKLVRVQRQARIAQGAVNRAATPIPMAQTAAAQTENVRKMLLAFSRDLRVVMLRLASRLQTLRHFAQTKLPVPPALARESLQVFAPLANRLGIWEIKWELEDLSFRFLEPDTYKQVAGLLDQKRVEREAYVERLRTQLQQELKKEGVNATVQGRPKHIYSIVKKMRGKSLGFDQVYDIRALRVIVASIPDCYAALSWVHNHFQPVTEEYDDYIAKPKANGYQSLHTIVRDESGQPIEVQIRTQAMHDHAEHGVAAHWAYKEAGVKGYGGVSAAGEYDAKIAVLRQLLAWERDLSGEHGGVFDDQIYVLTPDAAIVELDPLVARVPFNHPLRVLLARARADNGNHERAIELLEKVVAEDQRNIDAWYGLGKYAMQSGDAKRAVDDYLVRAQVLGNRLNDVTMQANVANVLGIAQWSLTVPPIPGGEFFVQAVAFDPPANALGLTTSNAGHAVLGL